MFVIVLAALVGDEVSVEPDLPGLGLVQSSEDLGEGGLAAAISAGHEHDLTRLQREIQRTQLEWRGAVLRRIREDDALEIESLPAATRSEHRCRDAARIQPAGHLLHSVDREAAPGDGRPRLDDVPE